MICTRCLRRASALRLIPSISRPFTSKSPLRESESPSPASSTASSTPIFTNPLTPASNSSSQTLKSKTPLILLPESITPAGTRLTGLNYLKGRDDPIALSEEEYPSWLWRCLDAKKDDMDGDEGDAGDVFSKSKKVRRKAAKRLRKIEEERARKGEVLEPKIPLTQQSIDLPGNEQGTIKGALEAERSRGDLTAALRRERRRGIKESNYLKTM